MQVEFLGTINTYALHGLRENVPPHGYQVPKHVFNPLTPQMQEIPCRDVFRDINLVCCCHSQYYRKGSHPIRRDLPRMWIVITKKGCHACLILKQQAPATLYPILKLYNSVRTCHLFAKKLPTLSSNGKCTCERYYWEFRNCLWKK